MEKLKVVFEKEYKSHKVGDVVEFEGRAFITLGNWLLANGIAVTYENNPKKSGCADCDKKHELEVTELKSEIERLNAIINGDDKKTRGRKSQDQQSEQNEG